MRRLRRAIRSLLRGFFRHLWEVTGATLDDAGTMTTTMTCARCGEVRQYLTLDRAAFVAIYRSRGCPGKASIGPMVIRGVFHREGVNANGRVYPRDMWEKHLNERMCTGQLEHPTPPTPTPSRPR